MLTGAALVLVAAVGAWRDDSGGSGELDEATKRFAKIRC